MYTTSDSPWANNVCSLVGFVPKIPYIYIINEIILNTIHKKRKLIEKNYYVFFILFFLGRM